MLTMTICLASYADRVTREQAEQQAAAFMQKTHASRARRAPGKLITDRVRLAKADADGNYFIFNAEDETSFAIVAGSDLVADPILGYGENGSFDVTDVPENLQSWLENYARQIAYMEANHIKPLAPRKAKSSISSKIATVWDQNPPYNNSCSGCVTGCVATAMAQIMKFYSYPSAIINTIPAHGGKPAKSAGLALNWSNMLNDYDVGSPTTTQISAVADLMLYCGQAVKMTWGASSSGANSALIPAALHRYFGYDDDMYYEVADDYSASDWADMIYGELAAGRPVLYDGNSSPSSGHCFIIDGYDGASDKFYVNWGWRGFCDGYYTLTLMNPPTKGTGGGSDAGGYTMYQGASFNVKPGNGTICPPRLRTTYTTPITTSATVAYYNLGSEGLHYVYPLQIFSSPSQVTEPDVSHWEYGFKLFKNQVPFDSPVYWAIDEVEGFVFSAYFSGTYNGHYGATFNIYVDESIPDGEYQLFPVSREYGTTEWQKDQGWNDHYIVMTISAGMATLAEGPHIDISGGGSSSDPVTVTANNLSMTYGDPVPTLTYSTSGSPLKGTPSLTTTATSTSDVGTYPITVSQGSVYNSSFTGVNGTLTINKASAACSINSVTKAVSDPMPTFTFSYSGWKNSDNESVLTTAPVAACYDPDAMTTPGTYAIVFATDPAAKNYDFVTSTGTLTVTADAGPTPDTEFMVANHTADGSGYYSGSGITGTVHFDKSSRTLTLNNATITATEKNSSSAEAAIYWPFTDGLTIKLVGTNTINLSAAGVMAILTKGNLTITSDDGKGSLTMMATNNGGGIVASDPAVKEMRIKDCSVSINAMMCIVDQNNLSTLYIDGAHLDVTASFVPFFGMKDIALQDCYIASPTDYVLSYSGGYVAGYLDSSSNVILDMTIEPDLELYGITVGDLVVDEVNCGDLFGDGTVSYNPATSVLTLNNASIFSTTSYGLKAYDWAKNGKLIVQLKGVNTISSSLTDAINADCDLTIESAAGESGVLLVQSTATNGIVFDGNLTFGPGTFTIDGNTMGIAGYDFPVNTLNIQVEDGADLTIVGPDGAVSGFDSFTMPSDYGFFASEDCAIGAKNGHYSICTTGGDIYLGTLVIKKVTTVDYGLSVCGVPVTSDNCTAVTDAAIDGTVSFDPATQTLTLKDVTLNYTGAQGNVIERPSAYSAEPLTINVEGIVIAESTDSKMEFHSPTTITGTGRFYCLDVNVYNDLTVQNSDRFYALAVNPQADNITVTIKDNPATNTKFTADPSLADVKLVIDASDVVTREISGFAAVELKGGTEFLYPRQAEYDATNKTLAYALNPAFDGQYHIGIFEAEDYGLSIGAEAVTDKNSAAVTGANIAGSVSFDPTSWTVTIDGATITDPRNAHAAIERQSVGYEQFAGQPLTIVLKGVNTLDGHSVILCPDNDLVIVGEGSLVCGVGTYSWEYFTAGNITIKDQVILNTSDKGLYFKGTQTLIQNSTVEAKGIAGTGVLAVDNSDITSTGKVYDFDDVVLQNAKYQTPEGASYDTTQKCVVNANGGVTGTVVIVSDATGINSVLADFAAGAAIYTLDGRRLQALQRGVNIVRMADGTVRKLLVK